jgi:hypothetical protein
MQTVTEHIRAHLLKGVMTTPVGDKAMTKEQAVNMAWSDEFETLMRNRLLMGRFRYGGTLKPKPGTKSNYDQVHSAIDRLHKYLDTGNQEHLVDAANLALVEFVLPSIDKPVFFEAADDGEHTKEIK